MEYSIVVLTSQGREEKLSRCLDSLSKITEAEIIVISEAGTISTKRNLGINGSSGKYLVFIDDDCIASDEWFGIIKKGLENHQVLAGNTVTKSSSLFGDIVAATGFPGGGSIGFDKVWKVDKEGCTNHVSFCNFACHKSVFEKVGLIEEMPYGAEDAIFSYRLTEASVKIKYLPEMIVFHEPRVKIIDFFRWQFTRGRSNYYFKQKVGSVKDFVKLRFWSAGNSLKKYHDIRLFFVIFVLFMSFIFQQYGYYYEKGFVVWKAKKSFQ